MPAAIELTSAQLPPTGPAAGHNPMREGFAADRASATIADRNGYPPMLVRRVSPQEDKIDLALLADDEWEVLARYLGALTGAAHRRGATLPSRKEALECREV